MIFLQKTGKNLSSFAFIFVMLIGLILGCGGDSGKNCVGEITVDGTTYEGKDTDEAQARQNTCSKYCIEGDKGYDRMYQEFIKTPEAKQISIDFNAEKVSLKEKKWAATGNKRLGEYIRQCEQGCLKLHNEGIRKIEVKCQ